MRKFFSLGLIISSLICYLEWADKSAFLFQVEYLIITQAEGLNTFSHPAIMIPMIGQLLLIASLFTDKAAIQYLGMGMISLLVLLIFFIGLASANYKIVLSAMPFIAIAVWSIIYNRRKSKKSNEEKVSF